MNVYPVIMCGGAGTRLWPVSRPNRAKQFASIIGKESLFRATVERVLALNNFARLIIVAGQSHARTIKAQLGQQSAHCDIVLEPEGRDSAPAIAAAAAHVHQLDPDGICVIVASDHHIPDIEHFRRDMAVAVEAAKNNAIVTLGIKPREPSTAYGYIRAEVPDATVSRIAQFAEKPDAERAQTYLTQGYLWNSGNFVAQAQTLIDEFSTHAPDVMASVQTALKDARHSAGCIQLSAAFCTAPKISIDYAVMEKTTQAAVVPSNLGWSDVGAWDAVHAASRHDKDGNAIRGDALLIESQNSLVINSGNTPAVVAFVDGLSVIVEDDVVFVAPLKRSQDVKTVVGKLKSDGRREIDFPKDGFSLEAAHRDLMSWFKTAAWPLWWSNGFDRTHGLWHESLTHDALPAHQNRRARVQGRQSYVYGVAAQLGWTGPAMEASMAAASGTKTLHINTTGLMRTLLDPDAQALDETSLLYDHTFSLLALAARNDFTTGADTAALELMKLLEAQYRNKQGAGFVERSSRAYQSNASMHLLEAAIAWHEATHDNNMNKERWADLADEIVELAINKFIHPKKGYLYEFFHPDWSPLSQTEGQTIEPGHQFEWAWLLTRWSIIKGDPALTDVARRLFNWGLAGLDPESSAAVEAMDLDGLLTTRQARLWSQAEWLKASLILHDTSGADEKAFYLEQAGRAYGVLNSYLQTPVKGLWYDKLKGNDFVDEPCPASSFYHLASALMQMDDSLKHPS